MRVNNENKKKKKKETIYTEFNLVLIFINLEKETGSLIVYTSSLNTII